MTKMKIDDKIFKYFFCFTFRRSTFIPLTCQFWTMSILEGESCLQNHYHIKMISDFLTHTYTSYFPLVFIFIIPSEEEKENPWW